MSARVYSDDNDKLRFNRQFSREQRKVELKSYWDKLNYLHELKHDYGVIKNDTLQKMKLVEEQPIRAAEMFYHCLDKEIGNMIVKHYGKRTDLKYWELAQNVLGVLKLRDSESNLLTNILGMKSIPLLNESDDYDQWISENTHSAG